MFYVFFLPVENFQENITSFSLNYVCMSGSAREFAHTSAGSLGGQKRTSSPVKLESQRVLDGVMWTSARAMTTLNRQTIFPPSIYFFLYS